MKIAEILNFLDELAPLSYQENYDNAGLIVGNADDDFSKGLICFDVNERVVNEALSLGCNLIISHHPFLFHPLKKITNQSLVEKILVTAIKNDLALYAVHTNIDNVINGVNNCFSNKLLLEHTHILQPKKQLLKKIVCFVPIDYADKVRTALFDAGCGNIGKYDCCSYTMDGIGTFRAEQQTNPFIGEIGKLHLENESRIETVFPAYKENQIVSALIKSHPYEEVAYDIYNLENTHKQVGSGMIGLLPFAMNEAEFLSYVKEKMNLSLIQHSKLSERKIKKVALCGGSGSFLIPDAISQQADVFITGEIHYHDFLTYENTILLASIGHYESENEIKHYLYEKLIEKFTTFAVSKAETNPIGYYF